MSMVNSKLEKGCIAFPFLIISWLLVSNPCNAQKISRYYKSTIQGNSILYFVMPNMEFENSLNGSKLNYDITYLTINDTATVNFSYIDKSVAIIDSIVFVQNNKRFSSSSKKLFIEPQKTKWYHRYSSRFSFNDLIFLFAQENRPQIMIYTKSVTEELNIKPSDWKRNAAIVTRILSMIKLNREK